MSIRFQCECGKKLKATDDKIGKRVLCPDCGQPVTVPSKDRMRAETLDAGAEPERPVQDSAKSAKELLKLSAVASRGEQDASKPSQKSGRQRGEEATLTFSEFLSQNGKRIGLPAAGVLVACLVLYFVSSSVFNDKPKYPPLFPVSGIVTLNGKPLADAQVTFRSQEALISDAKIKPGASHGQTDSDGRYSLDYKTDVPGAVTGFHLVEINKIGPDGIETLPAKFHIKTDFKIEVKADQAEGYDIKLQK
jgi:hypothetical protein